MKEIAKSVKVEYYNTSIDFILTRDIGYVTEGETGYKTIYKYLDCYLETILPIETEKHLWSSEPRLGLEDKPSKEQKDFLKSSGKEGTFM